MNMPIANLTEDQENQLKEIEDELGYVLVAYKDESIQK